MTAHYHWLDDHINKLATRYEAGNSLREIAVASDSLYPRFALVS
ncbi:hypothetical protein PN419_17380 [Halorubrum ezzemoulense]|nr:hypothetical protein [Halorubrum ezzemoulense]MDB9250747.1 hypothetical protein [Halorubrum ezzemoulense]MDB9260886.1 hypothetical protein [Halorubrum ezzemoulense]MDB9264294.1 hypothetical protein [Halorubrum ezzemoulense]MDB9267786.1 hypothetical protein [Halorubrum ezzemoulense]MDB9271247.1 hypothetical protein [Halorubrum ezzemoulense]